MASHSPGPWLLTELPFNECGQQEPDFRVEAASTLFLTVSPCADGFQFGQNEANARLIAAAPTMEQALRAVLLFHSSSPWTAEKSRLWEEFTGTPEATTKILCDTLRVILYEATGQPNLTQPESFPDRDPDPNYTLAERIAYENDDPSLQR